MKHLLKLAVTDFKLIFRDPSLRIFLVMPLLIFATVLLALPWVVESFEGAEKYVPIVLMGATMQSSTMFGFIYSMVLINEKDIHVARVYGILPVSKIGFVASRLVFPFALSTGTTFALLAVQPFYTFSLVSMALLAILCGLLAPLLTLLVCIMSKNKMEGMTWFKFINLLISAPLAAFFNCEIHRCIRRYPDALGLSNLGQNDSRRELSYATFDWTGLRCRAAYFYRQALRSE